MQHKKRMRAGKLLFTWQNQSVHHQQLNYFPMSCLHNGYGTTCYMNPFHTVPSHPYLLPHFYQLPSCHLVTKKFIPLIVVWIRESIVYIVLQAPFFQGM